MKMCLGGVLLSKECPMGGRGEQPTLAPNLLCVECNTLDHHECWMLKTLCFAILLSRIQKGPNQGLFHPLKDPHRVHLKGHAGMLGFRRSTTNKSGGVPGSISPC